MYLQEDDTRVFMNKDLEAEVILIVLVETRGCPKLSIRREFEVIKNPVSCDY